MFLANDISLQFFFLSNLKFNKISLARQMAICENELFGELNNKTYLL